MTCEKPPYEKEQEPNVYPVIIDSYRAVGANGGEFPTGRLVEIFAGVVGTIRAVLVVDPEPRGRLSSVGGPVGSLKVIP